MNRNNKSRVYVASALLIALLFSVLQIRLSSIGRSERRGSAVLNSLEALEGRSVDFRFKLRGPEKAHPRVVVLAVDQKSAQAYGLWPWKRAILARAFNKLLDAEVSAIGLDITFADATSQSQDLTRIAAQLDKIPEGQSVDIDALKTQLAAELAGADDALLEAAFRRGKDTIVQGIIPFNDNDVSSFGNAIERFNADLEPHLIRTAPGNKTKGSTVELSQETALVYPVYSAETPLSRFASTGTALAHFGVAPDFDGTIRRAPILEYLSAPNGVLPSIALKTAAIALQAKIVPKVSDEKQIVGVRFMADDKLLVEAPIESQSGMMLINYPGSASSFRLYGVQDLLEDKVPTADLKGAAVLVGITLVGSMGDQRVTPFNDFEAGVFTHASVLSNILSNRFLQRPWWSLVVELAFMLFSAATLALLVPRASHFRTKFALISLFVLGWFCIAYFSFARGLQLSMVVPLLNALTVSFALIFLGYFWGDRDKAQLRTTMSRYLGEDVTEIVIDNPDKLNVGEKREMTVLFSDVRGFTSLSERMQPEALAKFMNGYLSPMTQIVFEEKGTLDKYIGDAVMAFWNAPLDQPDHALRACRAAVKMLKALEVMQKEWKAQDLPQLEIGIGINTGQMVVGNMGSDVRVDYTVLGDSVNLGSRLEGTNKVYETNILVAESTWLQVKHAMHGRRLGAVRVKGKREPVGIFEVRGEGPASAADAEVIALFENALTLWKAQRFEESKAAFNAVLQKWPHDGPSRRYLAEIEELKGQPLPSDWDGVVSLSSK